MAAHSESLSDWNVQTGVLCPHLLLLFRFFSSASQVSLPFLAFSKCLWSFTASPFDSCCPANPVSSIPLNFFSHFLAAVAIAEVPEFCLSLIQVQSALLMIKMAN